jgi:hypothetical protein
MINCDPNALAAASACYCGPEDLQRAEIIYLLNAISGLNLTATQLAAASCGYNCIPQDLAWAEITYLLCANAKAAGA